ncbi:hypothetical protein ACOBR2_06605 [Telmatobacter bradus]|uniref:hypothetical protein n=1 Tax=Telmatobacter bradus TaxID=474953 RepID=UPI003B43D318
MTAHELIADIFGRAQNGMPGNERCITEGQLKYLRDLIGRDEEGAALMSDGPGVQIWAPSGRNKYILTEDLAGKKHRLRRLATLAPMGCGRLF